VDHINFSRGYSAIPPFSVSGGCRRLFGASELWLFIPPLLFFWKKIALDQKDAWHVRRNERKTTRNVSVCDLWLIISRFALLCFACVDSWQPGE
jgi:hypothetical protein